MQILDLPLDSKEVPSRLDHGVLEEVTAAVPGTTVPDGRSIQGSIPCQTVSVNAMFLAEETYHRLVIAEVDFCATLPKNGPNHQVPNIDQVPDSGPHFSRHCSIDPTVGPQPVHAHWSWYLDGTISQQ